MVDRTTASPLDRDHRHLDIYDAGANSDDPSDRHHDDTDRGEPIPSAAKARISGRNSKPITRPYVTQLPTPAYKTTGRLSSGRARTGAA